VRTRQTMAAPACLYLHVCFDDGTDSCIYTFMRVLKDAIISHINAFVLASIRQH
jgi:hypothetical protein